jgi:WD40 repeat protein
MQSPDVSIKSIAWSPGDADNGEIRDGLSDQTIRVMDDYSHDGSFGAEGWSPDGKEIISVDLSDLVIWDANTGATIWKTPFDGNGNIFISWSPDGNYIAWTNDGLGGIVTAASGAMIESFQTSDGIGFDALARPPHGHYIATASGGAIQLWQAPS